MKLLQSLLTLGLIWLGGACAGKEILVAFVAEWCGPCQQFKRDLVEDPELASNYQVEMVDVDLAKEMADEFEVKTVPTFFVVKVGDDDVIKKENVVKKHVGYRSREQFKRWLKR